MFVRNDSDVDDDITDDFRSVYSQEEDYEDFEDAQSDYSGRSRRTQTFDDDDDEDAFQVRFFLFFLNQTMYYLNLKFTSSLFQPPYWMRNHICFKGRFYQIK